MTSPSHLPILKRVGWVLLAVGLLDIAVMVYCLVNSIDYSSSFNIFAVLGGAFLLRGSLRAASIIRWFAVFMTAGFVSVLVALPLLQPLGLTLTQIRLSPVTATLSLLVFAVLLVLLWWVAMELGSRPVLAAQSAAGRMLTSSRIAVAAGVGLAVVLAVSVNLVQRTESAAKAISLVKEQLGPGYAYHVSSLNYQSSGARSSVSGVVTAWSEVEVRNVPFEWRD